MTLEDFRTLIRAYVPGAKIKVIDNTLLTLLINKGVDDTNSFGKLLDVTKKFNVKAEQAEYDIFSEITADFLTMDRPGIWWNAGTATKTNWIQMIPKTAKWLDRFQTNWRDEGSGDPIYYFYKNGKFTFHPKPSTTLSNGFWLYYSKTSVNMTLSTHFPFTGATDELPHLRDMDDAIIDYVRWKLQRPLGKEAIGVIAKDEYKDTRLEKLGLINRRDDISAHRDAKMRIPLIRGMHHSSRRHNH